jgi:radical SAM protein with 4Fe4S-binding SPASM domain
MANIAITSLCNLNCQYCFTQEAFKGKENNSCHMSVDDFKLSLAILKRSKKRQVSVLGGEPTLHPRFTEFINLILESELEAKVFTNGIMSEKIRRFLAELPESKITIIVNINNLKDDLDALPESLTKTLNALKQKVIPGFNIYSKDLQLFPLLDFIDSYDLQKKIRLGLAHPCTGFKNKYLPLKHYFLVGTKILEFAQRASNQNVKLILDCGFVPCMFGSSSFREYGIDREIGLRCDPIPDILPDGTVISCYPLFGYDNKNIRATEDISLLRENMRESHKVLEDLGIFKTCSVCYYRRKEMCNGGCSAHKLLRLNKMDDELSLKI